MYKKFITYRDIPLIPAYLCKLHHDEVNTTGQTPLLWVVLGGHDAVVRLVRSFPAA
jgi:hypothetical protein